MKIVYKKDDEQPGREKKQRVNPVHRRALAMVAKWRKDDRAKGIKDNQAKIDVLRVRNSKFLK